MLNTSFDTTPSRVDKSYGIETSRDPFDSNVDDAREMYLLCKRQEIDVHCTLGIHRLLDPVSRITLKI